jgi:hypothetical protein
MWFHLKWRVVHQCHMNKLVRIRYISTDKQKADTFTKNLTPAKHEKAVSMLSIVCDEMKAEEYEHEEQRSAVLRRGVKILKKKHACIYRDAKECDVCKRFYAGIK